MAPLKGMDMKNAVRAGIIGHAIGDALGVPVEFSSRSRLNQCPVHDMEGYGTHDMPAGTWSDDTSMEIALMQSLIDKGSFDYEDIMENFCQWWENDKFTATGKGFDIGGTCYRAIRNYSSGKCGPHECGEKDEHSNGNGSLMRILPVAFVCHKYSLTGNQRYDLVRKVSSLTHAHEISVLGCCIYVNFVCHLLSGKEKGNAYVKTKQDDYSAFSEDTREIYSRVLQGDIAKSDEEKISSSGYVVSSLEASLWSFLNADSFKQAVLKAVNLGNDTDTVGAITGSMAGIYYGYDSIPAPWIKELKRSGYLLELCDKFVQTEIKV